MEEARGEGREGEGEEVGEEVGEGEGEGEGISGYGNGSVCFAL